jgi:hypothetical protein
MCRSQTRPSRPHRLPHHWLRRGVLHPRAYHHGRRSWRWRRWRWCWRYQGAVGARRGGGGGECGQPRGHSPGPAGRHSVRWLRRCCLLSIQVDVAPVASIMGAGEGAVSANPCGPGPCVCGRLFFRRYCVAVMCSNAVGVGPAGEWTEPVWTKGPPTLPMVSTPSCACRIAPLAAHGPVLCKLHCAPCSARPRAVHAALCPFASCGPLLCMLHCAPFASCGPLLCTLHCAPFASCGPLLCMLHCAPFASCGPLLGVLGVLLGSDGR